MNKLYLILLISFNTTIFGQNIKIGNDVNQIAVYEYALKNLEKIKNNNSEALIYVSIDFNKNNFVEKVTYFSATYENKKPVNKKEIEVLFELDNYIKETFSFFSNNIFFEKHIGEANYSFYIPLSKQELQSCIDTDKQNKKLKKTADTIGILPNSNFIVNFDNLYLNKTKFENRTLKSTLKTLNSELIEIIPNLYLVFRIIKTNAFNTNISNDFIEYKIMYLRGTSSELITTNRENIYGNIIEISEVPTIGTSDTLEDLSECDSDSDGLIINTSRAFENLKFTLKITFNK